ncbi:hypothetical protein EV421DRAFT_1735801 [Armillaria borealis]|uniref:Uncharacterized protein n=1 Tax=Armillaria borealis TaxID=47425 RepID=A0AA39JJR6_9AGAR|nr:hypothetical protein EV421DRAFT_1735801 [Armillaria borealis]
MRMGLNQAVDEAGQLAANELRKAGKSKKSRKGKRKSKRLMIMVSERRLLGGFAMSKGPTWSQSFRGYMSLTLAIARGSETVFSRVFWIPTSASAYDISFLDRNIRQACKRPNSLTAVYLAAPTPERHPMGKISGTAYTYIERMVPFYLPWGSWATLKLLRKKVEVIVSREHCMGRLLLPLWSVYFNHKDVHQPSSFQMNRSSIKPRARS